MTEEEFLNETEEHLLKMTQEYMAVFYKIQHAKLKDIDFEKTLDKFKDLTHKFAKDSLVLEEYVNSYKEKTKEND